MFINETGSRELNSDVWSLLKEQMLGTSTSVHEALKVLGQLPTGDNSPPDPKTTPH